MFSHNFWLSFLGQNCCRTCKCDNHISTMCAFFSLNSSQQFRTPDPYKCNNSWVHNNTLYNYSNWSNTLQPSRVKSFLLFKFRWLFVTQGNTTCCICLLYNKRASFVCWYYRTFINVFQCKNLEFCQTNTNLKKHKRIGNKFFYKLPSTSTSYCPLPYRCCSVPHETG